MEVAICGGGNIGHSLASYLGYKGHKVNILTSKPEKWAKVLTGIIDDKREIKSELSIISSDPSEIIPRSDIVFITVPSYAKTIIFKRIVPFIENKPVIFVPGSGGIEFAIHSNFKQYKMQIFGLQRVPFISRTKVYGKVVRYGGAKKKLFLSNIALKENEQIRLLIEDLFDIPTEYLQHYLEITLVPSNPLLHPARLYEIDTILKDQKNPIRKIYFYSQWGDLASEILVKMNSELQRLSKSLNLNLPDILNYYEVSNVKELTKKIRSIKSWSQILAPLKRTSDGIIVLDKSSRYFTEDIPYGLAIIKAIAEIFKINTPTIDSILEWAQNIMNKEYIIRGTLNGGDVYELNIPQNYGIETERDLFRVYS